MNRGLDTLPELNKNSFCSAGSQTSASLVAKGKILAVFFQLVFAYTVCVFSGCHGQALAPAFFQRRRASLQLPRWRSLMNTNPAVRFAFVFSQSPTLYH